MERLFEFGVVSSKYGLECLIVFGVASLKRSSLKRPSVQMLSQVLWTRRVSPISTYKKGDTKLGLEHTDAYICIYMYIYIYTFPK